MEFSHFQELSSDLAKSILEKFSGKKVV